MMGDYGASLERYGAWVQLEFDEQHGEFPPIDKYARGKYLVDGAWHRSTELPFYSAAELADARGRALARRLEASQAAAERELDTGGFEIGRRVYAQGRGGDGVSAWFVAEVVGHRERFPP